MRSSTTLTFFASSGTHREPAASPVLHRIVAAGVLLMLTALPGTASADDTAAPTPPVPSGSSVAPTTSPAAPTPAAAAPLASAAGNAAPTGASDARNVTAPTAATPSATKEPVLGADPVADGAMILGAASFAGLLELINGTGEIRPQQVSADPSHLLGIDQGAITQTIDPSARSWSNVALIAAAGFAMLDPVLSGLREQSVHAALVDAVIYAEAVTITWGVTGLTKMAVRRPRPQAYIDAEAHKDEPGYSNASTDSSLSFFSGHASMTASISATATYLAFARSPHTFRPWLTLGLGTALTTFVSVERVRGGAHFPTDVIAGAIAGAGIGVLVAHLHRVDALQQRKVWLGFAPDRGGGGTVELGGAF